MKNNVYQSTILLCLLLAASPAPAWTITNITVGVDSNSAAWGKVNLNNNNFTGWLNDHEGRLNTNSLTVSNLNSSLTNLAALGLVTNHQSGVTLSGTFSNSTFAGNGTYLTSLNGASLTAGTVNSNKFDSGTLALFGGGGPLRFSSSPLVITATNGQLFLTGGTNAFNGNGTVADLSAYDITNHVGRGLQFQGYGGGSFGQFPVNFIGHGGDGDNVSVKFIADGDLRFEPNEAGGGGKLSCAPANFGIDFPGVGNGAFFVDTTGTGFTGINQPSPSYQLDVGGTFACDNAQIYSDGGGNLTAQTFNPVSDRARKENIRLLDPDSALQMALALTNYTWRFKGSTNLVTSVTRITNSAATNGPAWATNVVANIRPATGKEFGPMAQDWKAVTGLGGGTNISLTAMNGLLLGAVQGLNQKLAADEQFPRIPAYTPPHSASTTFGYGPGLLVCDANNLYVSIGTNAWSRISLPTNTW